MYNLIIFYKVYKCEIIIIIQVKAHAGPQGSLVALFFVLLFNPSCISSYHVPPPTPVQSEAIATLLLLSVDQCAFSLVLCKQNPRVYTFSCLVSLGVFILRFTRVVALIIVHSFELLNCIPLCSYTSKSFLLSSLSLNFYLLVVILLLLFSL